MNFGSAKLYCSVVYMYAISYVPFPIKYICMIKLGPIKQKIYLEMSRPITWLV